MEGDKVNLLCIINNDVHANYSLQNSWYKDNKLIIPNGKRISLRNEGSRQLKSTLILDPVIPTDEGVYTCRAYNHPDLYAESKTNLTVECEIFSGCTIDGIMFLHSFRCTTCFHSESITIHDQCG